MIGKSLTNIQHYNYISTDENSKTSKFDPFDFDPDDPFDVDKCQTASNSNVSIIFSMLLYIHNYSVNNEIFLFIDEENNKKNFIQFI